jgi:toxin ParE1/3/4
LKYTFKPEAELEFTDAIDWYERQKPELGRDFAIEFRERLMDALHHPDRYRKVRGKARVIRLKRFRSYGICFVVQDEILSVLAVFHAARDPAELNKRF